MEACLADSMLSKEQIVEAFVFIKGVIAKTNVVTAEDRVI